jgi:hypothetical protein
MKAMKQRTRKRGPGRPRANATDNLSVSVFTRFRIKDALKLKRAADKKGLRPSSLVRDVVLKALASV